MFARQGSRPTCAVAEGGMLLFGDGDGHICISDRTIHIADRKHKAFRGAVLGIAYIFDPTNPRRQYVVAVGDDATDDHSILSAYYMIKARLTISSTNYISGRDLDVIRAGFYNYGYVKTASVIHRICECSNRDYLDIFFRSTRRVSNCSRLFQRNSALVHRSIHQGSSSWAASIHTPLSSVYTKCNLNGTYIVYQIYHSASPSG